MRPRIILPLLTAAVALAIATSASAQADSGSGELRASGAVGETAAGYMAAVPSATLSDELKRGMDQINIKRRAFYTDKAGAAGMTVSQYAQNAACGIFKNSVKPGQWYRDEAGAWHKAVGAAPLPSWCEN